MAVIDHNAIPEGSTGGESGASRASAQALEAQAMLAAIVESSDDAIIGKTLDGVITTWNGAAERIFGYSRAEAVGRPISILIPPDRQQEETDILQRLRRGERIQHFETVRIAKDGRMIDVSLTISPIKDSAGNIVGASKIVRDVSERKQIEAKLEANQIRTMFAMEIMEAGEWDLNLTDNTAHRSVRHDQIFGYDSLLPAWTYEMFLEHVLPEDREGVARAFGEALATRKNWDFECRIVRRDKAVRWIKAVGRHYDFSNSSRLVGVVQDITERKRADEVLRESEGRLRAIVDSAIDGIIAIDEQGRITSFNPAAMRLFGYTPQEVMGRNVNMLMPAPYHDEHDGYLQNFRDTGVKKIIGIGREVAGRRKDGQTFPMELGVSQTIVGDRRIFTGIIRDLSERNRANQLRLARDEAEQANRAKSQFLANMSHELRTPLNAIIGYSEMLLEDIGPSAAEAARSADLERIRDAGKQLLALINDILDLSKVEANKMELHLQTVDVPMMIQEVVEIMQPMVGKTGSRLDVLCPPDLGTIWADLGKARQILCNLLSNALKFTQGGTVTLEADRSAWGGRDWLRFVVSDTGIGMTPQQVAKLFQAFAQAEESTSIKFGGTGLGLAISRRLCHMMGGDITVSSTAGKGSVFTVHLPVEVQAPSSQPPKTEPLDAVPLAGDQEGAHVLIIDDDPAARDLLARALAADGYSVRVANGGEEGLRMARLSPPMAITLDLLMPGLDGWAVLAALKADENLADTPVIVISIIGDQGQAAGMSLGANEFLAKPVNRERLQRIVAKYGVPGASVPIGPILVVDDDPAARELIGRTLRALRWQLVEAADGRAALDAVARRLPAMILLDLMMPNMDGFEFVAELRKTEAWRAIPIVVMTSKTLEQADRDRLNAGVQRILTKATTSRDELLQEVRRTLKNVLKARRGAGAAV